MPWWPLGLREVEAFTFSDIRLIDGGKVVSPTHRPLFTPKKIPGTHFCCWVDPRAIVRLEGLGKLKKSTSSGTRTGDLPACSLVPEPTTLPRNLFVPARKILACRLGESSYWCRFNHLFLTCEPRLLHCESCICSQIKLLCMDHHHMQKWMFWVWEYVRFVFTADNHVSIYIMIMNITNLFCSISFHCCP
jgi:hypothetical protein